MMRNLIDAGASAPATHLVYVGIAGIEDGAALYDYYRAKLECEGLLRESGRPHTIVRVTQFHPFVDFLFRMLSFGLLLLRPLFQLQPVGTKFAAERIASHALSEPKGRAPDIHGPEALTSQSLARSWLASQQRIRASIPVPGLGPFKALAKLRAVSGDGGGETWAQWLAENARNATAYRR